MTKKRKIILACCIAGVVLLWCLTLGLHFSFYVRAYCHGHEAYDQPEVYVFMGDCDAQYQEIGIPLVCMLSRDTLPYPLRIRVCVDNRIIGDSVVVESMEVEYKNGDKVIVIGPEHCYSGEFKIYEPVESDRIPGRIFRAGWIDIPAAIDRRESFQMTIKGHVTGSVNIPFERKLKMDYSREFNIYTGWQLLAGASC